MRLLSIDQGTQYTGWAVFESDDASRRTRLVASDTIKLNLDDPTVERAREVVEALRRVREIHRVDEYVLEDAFVGINRKTSMIFCRFTGMLELGLWNVFYGPYSSQVPYPAVEPPRYMKTEWAKRQLGSARASDEDSVAAAIRDWGATPKRHDEADAIHIGAFHLWRAQNPVEYSAMFRKSSVRKEKESQKKKVSSRTGAKAPARASPKRTQRGTVGRRGRR